MQVFKTFFKIAAKNLPAISIYLIIFIVLIFAFGFSSKKEMDSKFQSQKLDICIIDEDQSPASRSLYNYLDDIHNLVSLENDKELLCDCLYYRYISYILFIPEGFEENLIAGNADGLLTNMKVPGSTNGQFVDQQIDAYLSSVHAYMAGGFPVEDAFSMTNQSLKHASKVELLSFDTQNTTEKKEIFHIYQYLPYVLISLLICGVAPILITFRKNGLHERICCSSLPNRRFTLQLAGGCLSYSFFILGVLFFLAAIVLREGAFSKNALLGLLNSVVFLLFAIGLTLFISNFMLPTQGINMIANSVALGMSFLSGVFVPQYMLAGQILAVSRFLPSYWYIRVNNMLAGFVTEPFDAKTYWQCIGIELLFAAAIFILALLASRYRKQKSLSM